MECPSFRGPQINNKALMDVMEMTCLITREGKNFVMKLTSWSAFFLFNYKQKKKTSEE